MSDFGTSSFYGGFTPNPSSAPPEQPRHGSSKAFLYFLLILVCGGLGALLNWGVREHQTRKALAADNLKVRKDYTFVLAKRNDLASFLTHEKTRLFRLGGRQEANGTSVTVAWQEETRTGILIGDRIPIAPEGQAFALWRLGPDRQPSAAGTFLSEPAGTYHDFRVPTAQADTTGFLVTLEADSEHDPKAPGRTVYETP